MTKKIWNNRSLRKDRPTEVTDKPVPVKDLKRKLAPGNESWFAKCKREDPERFAEMRRKAEATGRLSTGRPKGVGHGFTKHVIMDAYETAKQRAEVRYEQMEKNGEIDINLDNASKIALKAALQIVEANNSVADDHVNKELVSPKDRIAAARLVLDFTMAKPAAKTEITHKGAEDWLNDLLDEDKKGTE
ncbi:hypothetical protein [Teichococcus vastitatis]|uniref:hypothetical protein n=1 Tax=Teichococcus vastitatis TaxID=2307076 RepID=UPI0013009E63|nr:hypothetical protein [Pseudoroseomonas vastitatis]